jgi:hypothetical protein
MSRTAFLMALWCTSAFAADEYAARPGPGSELEAGSSRGSGYTSPAPVQVRPLHRHPTLFSMLVRNNLIRRRVGLPPHRMNPALTAAAQDHANYMARTGQFSHYTNGGPQGRAYKYGFTGGVRENIAMGGDVDTAFNMWQASGAHYASIVSNTTDAGFGYAIGPNGVAYFVGVYGNASPEDGETEEQIASYLEQEKQAAAQLAQKKTAAEKGTEATPVSATLGTEQKPAPKFQPAAAGQSSAK